MIISNSQTEKFATCERAHYFGYELKLQPKIKNKPIRTGVLGHEALEAYYRAKKAELPQKDCLHAGLDVISSVSQYANSDVLAIVTKRYCEYVKHYWNEPWRIIDVEGIYAYPMTDEITFALQLDLLVEITHGKYKGEQAVVDTKWSYNFWTDDEVFMNAQIPKYIGALRKLGSNARVGYINNVRYRPLKDGYTTDMIFRRTPIEPPQERIDNILGNQEEWAKRIRARRDFPLLLRRDMATPNQQKEICKNCDFKTPCSIMLDGRDPTKTINAMYEPNTYGYNEESIRRNA